MKIICQHCSHRFQVASVAFNYGTPTVKCPYCQSRFKPAKQKIAPGGTTIVRDKVNTGDGKNIESGWLVVHDENAPLQTFSLNPGKHLVGRKSVSKPCDIMIDTEDKYMSRAHFWIEVKRSGNGRFHYILSDAQAANHTYITTREMKMIDSADEYILQDGDTIQAGLTKIVFKNNNTARDKNHATQLVIARPYTKTQVLKK